MRVVSPWRGEFGYRCFFHAPAVHVIPGRKVVCCEYGTETLTYTLYAIRPTETSVSYEQAMEGH